MADIGPFATHPGLGHEDLPHSPLVHHGNALLKGLCAANLRAHLHHHTRLSGSFDHLPSFDDVVRAGLLDVDVFAGLTAEDRRRSVPVVRRRNGDGVDRAIVEYSPHVGHGLVGLQPFLPVLRSTLIGIASIGDSHTQLA